MKTKTLATTAAAALLAAAPAFATSAVVATDLNLRAGPGSNYVIQAVMPAESAVDVEGCVAAGDWCRVTYEGVTGFAYAPYLAINDGESFRDFTADGYDVIAFDDTDEGALIGGAAGATAASAVIGGPAAIAGGALIGSLAGAEAPEAETVTYVRENPAEPSFALGETFVGATVPAEVSLVESPDERYLYGNLNGDVVLVDAETREIAYIIR